MTKLKARSKRKGFKNLSPQGENLSDADVPMTKTRQQEGGRVRIWAGIADQTNIGPFKVDEGVKLNNANYWDFMYKTFFEWYKSQPGSFKAKCVFMHNNAALYVSKVTHEFILA